jgi:hypothetical protein
MNVPPADSPYFSASAMRELEALRGEQEALDLRLQNLIEALETMPRHDADGSHALQAAFGALLPHQVRSAYFRSRIQPQLNACVSFRSLMSIRSARMDLGGINHEWRVNDKVAGADFARSAGIDCPLRHGVFSRASIPDLDGVVIKPVQGTKSRGVFIRHDQRIIELKSGTVLDSTAALQERMLAFPAADWLVEEFLPDVQLDGSPARDLKFFCFFGRVFMAVEVVRYPDYRCCWWSRAGHAIETGYLGEFRFDGLGFDAAELAAAEHLSAQIPAPFMRIDMLKSSRGTRFGEFTPRPGEYDKFNAATDHELGKEFLLAESRLVETLLGGEQFALFRKPGGYAG